MRASITYTSLLWLIAGATAAIVPNFLLPPVVSDLMNKDKSQPGAPQTPELLKGSPYCVQAYEIRAGDTCFSIAQQHGLATEQIRYWSPVVRDDGCDSLPVGGRVCVAVANEPEALRWTPEKQAVADEMARKKYEEEEAQRKKEEDERKKKEEEERKKKEEEDRKNREEEEKKRKAEELERKKIPMWRDGKIRWPDPKDGKYPYVFYGRGSVIWSSKWGYTEYYMDRPDQYKQRYLTDYCDDRCTFWTLEEIKEPMGERFVPGPWHQRAMGAP
ncbi:hypothetical protein PpBr36_04102 [Pyricularia pennisetigena]|uniref:hypothetical protein n=1 Tax=Pyricularia pennisetigena TaxID=1578925 RepID=UPI00114EA75E|nr:hypothetical protein PpBr36_04102 [Pyricularia pennisetigena]TLS27438.1 hypothetical protein PpBr36_04102 [Pyricularia pennisetigena]